MFGASRAMFLVTVVLIPIAMLSTLAQSLGSENRPRVDVTQLFDIKANSTCGGEPPTSFQSRFGTVLNCSLGEHNASFALDGDPNTWWQSQNGDDPVALTFSNPMTGTSLNVERINIFVIRFPPRVITFEVKHRGSSQFSLIQAYTFNDQDGSCTGFDDIGISCSNFSYGIPDVNGNKEITVLVYPMDISLPVEEFRLIMSGFRDNFSPETQYYTLVEVEIQATILTGYFTHSLHSIVVEGENGTHMDSGDQVKFGANPVTFPEFSSRGYAQLEYDNSQRVSVQWVFPDLPRTTNYRFIVRYRNIGISRRVVGMVIQGETSMNTRITFVRDHDCIHPCYADLENPSQPQNPEPAYFHLNTQDSVAIAMTLSSTNILLDAIIALPEEFVNPSNLSKIDFTRFIQECNISSGELRTANQMSSDFCIGSAIQLSLDFFCATPACACHSPGSVNQDCEIYGGQCPCIDVEAGFAPVRGRQCNLCPFYSYLTPSGCTSCSCPDQLDVCDTMTGLCSNCPSLVEGRSCNVCVANSFGDPSMGCMRCNCSEVGSQSCNSTTGECICKTGVGGVLCDHCIDGSFNFTSRGCDACNCDIVGSEGVNCSELGSCTCKAGVGGMICSDCADGFFALSSTGCLPCNCSGQTTDCQLHPSSEVFEPRELCQCPFPYTGDSCEYCEDGYYLSIKTGGCETCLCNGRADICEDGTGECIDCSDNTTGRNCEECLMNFYVVTTTESDIECQPCPCNTTTAINVSCEVNVSGNPECYCRPGHDGPLCDACLPGYFGSPPQWPCRSCDCNGNIDLDIPGSCDKQTGVCLMCINNSTGLECELCADGYYGDATIQSCQPCNCNNRGSTGESCDSEGQCNCLVGVGGLKCDSCLPGYWNFTDGIGCTQCLCAEGSINGECDEMTGVCQCTEGVGGDDCSTCLDGYFNFTRNGCLSCMCGLGAVDLSCSEDGRCICQPGVIGDKCDQCESFYTDLSPSGCQPCSQCEQDLRFNLTLTEVEHNLLSESLVRIMSLVQTNNSGFEEVFMFTELLQENVSVTDQYLDDIQARLKALNMSTTDFSFILNVTNENVAAARTTLIDLSPYAESVHEHIVEVSNNVQDVQVDAGRILRFSDLVDQSNQRQLNIAKYAATSALKATVQHSGNYSATVDEAMLIYSQAQQVSIDAHKALRLTEMQLEQIFNITSYFQILSSSLEMLILQTNDHIIRDNDIKTKLANNTATTDELDLKASMIEQTIRWAIEALGNAEQFVRQAEYSLIMVIEDIRTLSELVGQTSSHFSGDGSALFSGSGDSEESFLITPEPIAETILGGVELFQRNLVELKEMFTILCAYDVQQAMDYTHTLSNQMDQIDSILTSSLASGNKAVETIIEYDESIAMIHEALDLTIMANQSILSVLSDINTVMSDNIASTAVMLLNMSTELLSSTEGLNHVVTTSLLPAVTKAREAYEQSENQTQNIIDFANILSRDLNKLARAVSTNEEFVNNTLTLVQNKLEAVEEIYESVSRVVPAFDQNITRAQLCLDEVRMTFNDVDDLVDSANTTALAAWDALTSTAPLISDINSLSRNNQMELEALNSSIDNLQLQLERALQAAASIDLALRFYGNTSNTYSIPVKAVSAPSYSTTISMLFQPETNSSGCMLALQENQANKSLALRYSNGTVNYEYYFNNTSVANASVTDVRDGEWYQLYASVDADTLALSVAPFQSDGVTVVTTREFSVAMTPPSLSLDDDVLLGAAEQTEFTYSDGFAGCLDRVIINNAQIPLLLPNEMNRFLSTCSPRPPAELPRVFETGVWIQGSTSFILVDFTSQLPSTSEHFEINFSFRTFAFDGILIYLTDITTTHYLLIYFDNGQIILNLSLSGLDFTQLNTTDVYNDGQWYDIGVVLDGQSVTLTVGIETLNTNASFTSAFNPSGIVSIGSPTHASGAATAQLSAALRSIQAEPLFSASGCIRNLQITGVNINISENAIAQQNVSFNGCPVEVSAGMRFMGGGFAWFDSIQLGNESLGLNISISFRGSQLAASLLNLPLSQVSLSIFHTRVRVDVGSYGLLILSQATNLNNNQWHTVVLTIIPDPLNANYTITKLIVDGVLDSTVSAKLQVPVVAMSDSLFVGGIADRYFAVVVGESFRGCIGNVIVNNRPLDFVGADKLINVALYGCQPPSLIVPTLPPPPPLPPPPSTRPNATIGLNGSDTGFISLRISGVNVLKSFSIVLEFQTASSVGVLLYLQGSVYADFIALQIKAGKLVFSYNLGSGRVDIESEDQYNDGVKHTVELHRFEHFGVMLIDNGAEYLNGSSPGTFTDLNIDNGFLFLGGIPEIINSVSLFPGGVERPLGFLACFLSLSINGVYERLTTAEIQAGRGVEPCISSYNNVAYFGANSYGQIFNNFYAGKRFTFAMDIRTYNCTGILLYVATPLYPDHLLLELTDGMIRFVFDNGPGEEVVEYRPPNDMEICDGQWHSIIIEKDGETGYLTVDRGSRHSVTSVFSNFLAVDTNHPLYIGGVPESVRLRPTVENGSFEGCINNFSFARDGRELQHIPLSQITDAQNVQLYVCRL